MLDSHTQVKAAETIAMFEDDLAMAIRMAAASQVYVLAGWLPPRNPHTNVIEVHARDFGLNTDEATKAKARDLLEQVALGEQERQQIVIDDIKLIPGQELGYAVERNIVVVCISDSDMFTFDFCARLAENTYDKSVLALS